MSTYSQVNFAFSVFTSQNNYLDKIGFRGCNPEFQMFLQTPISISCFNYGNYGQIPIVAILEIWL